MKRFLSVVLSFALLPTIGFAEEAYKYTDFLKSETAELKTLLDECAEKGITAEYERASYNILSWYVESDFMKKDEQKMLECEAEDDVLCGKGCTEDVCELRDILTYNENALTQMYTEAKNNLTGYLRNEKSPKNAGTAYDMTDMSVDDDGILRDKNGKALFSVGYASTLSTSWDLKTVSGMGATNAVVSKPPSMIYTENVAKNWVSQPSGNVVYEKTDVDGKNAVKIISGSETSSFSMKQTAEVTPGNSYTFSVTAKGSNVGLAKLNIYSSESNGWLYGKDISKGYFSSDWKTVSVTFTPTETKLDFDFALVGACDELYISSLSLKKSGDSENLLKNSDFSEDADSNINVYWFKSVQNALKQAKEAGTTVSLIIDPHYFPTLAGYENDTSLYAKNADGSWKTNEFIKFNINHPKAKEVIGDYLNTIGKILKDDPNASALSNIILTNESSFSVANFTSFYLEDYQNYLEERYGNIANLNAKWGTNFSGFSDINYIRAWCGGDAPGDYDTIRYNEDVFAEWHSWMANILKTYLPNIKISAKVMSYLDLENNPYWQLGKGANIEKFANFSDLTGNDAYTFSSYSKPVDKNSFSFKMMWYDFLRSLTGKPSYNSEDHIIAEGDNRYQDEIRTLVRADLWQGAVHGRQMSSVWNFSTHDYNGIYDSDSTNNYLFTTRPDCMEEIAHTGLNLRKYSDILESLNRKSADIAILYSESSRVHVNTDRTETNGGNNPGTKHLQQLFEAYKGAIFAGAKVDFVSEDNPTAIKKCDIVIVPYAEHVTDEAFSALKDVISAGGKVLLAGDCFMYDECHNERSEALNGASVLEADTEEEYRACVTQLMALDDIRVVVKDNEGKVCDSVEWNYTILGGKLYVNLMNYGDAKILKIYVNGEKLDAGRELLTDSDVAETVSADKFAVKLLEYAVPDSFGDSLSGELYDFAVSADGKITWSTKVEEKYAGASIYKVTNLGVEKLCDLFGKTEYVGEAGTTYEIREYGKNTGTRITVGGTDIFAISAVKEGGFYRIHVKNKLSSPAHGIVTMTVNSTIKKNCVTFTAGKNEERDIVFFAGESEAEFAVCDNEYSGRVLSNKITK